jgi:hypothetical protein
MACFITVKRSPWAVITWFLLLVVALTLWVFLAQQMYYVSKNVTQIELDKIDDLEEKWRKAKANKKVYVHAYNKGFVENWKAFLFPPVVKKHEPRDYSKEIAEREKGKPEPLVQHGNRKLKPR